MRLDSYGIRLRYHGLEGLSQIGFKKYEDRLADLFPTADELVLSVKAYFYRLDESAAILYELSEARFGIVENDRLLELAVSNPRGEYTGLILDVLALEAQEARMMMDDLEQTCGFIRSRFRDALNIMEMSEDDYLRRLRDSLRLLAHQLRR